MNKERIIDIALNFFLASTVILYLVSDVVYITQPQKLEDVFFIEFILSLIIISLVYSVLFKNKLNLKISNLFDRLLADICLILGIYLFLQWPIILPLASLLAIIGYEVTHIDFVIGILLFGTGWLVPLSLLFYKWYRTFLIEKEEDSTIDNGSNKKGIRWKTIIVVLVVYFILVIGYMFFPRVKISPWSL